MPGSSSKASRSAGNRRSKPSTRVFSLWATCTHLFGEMESVAHQLVEALEKSMAITPNRRFRIHLRSALTFAVLLVGLYVQWPGSVGLHSAGVLGGPIASPKIMGGELAPKGRYLYAANLIVAPLGRKGHVCGGMLVKENFVLTAAHCAALVKRFPWMFKVLVGNYDLNKKEKEEEEFRIHEVLIHPQYNKDSINYDFALLRLYGASNHTPVKLDSGSVRLDESSDLTAIGWGIHNDRRVLSPRLKRVGLKYVPNEKCKEVWKLGRMEVTDAMICTFPKDGEPWRSGAFKGDSGGPLLAPQVADNGAPTGSDICVGVVSWGFPLFSHNGGFPGVYSRTSSAIEWIQEGLAKPTPESPPPEPWLVTKVLLAGLRVVDLILRASIAGMVVPFLLRFSRLENKFGLNLDRVLSSIKYLLFAGAFVFAMYVRVVLGALLGV